MREDWKYFILAFVMASTLWFAVSGREAVEAWVSFRVEMQGMPENMVLLDGLTPSVDVRVKAPKGLIRSVAEKPQAYSLDLSDLALGTNIITISPESIPLSSAYEVVEVRPSRLILETDVITSVMLPAMPKYVGDLAPDMKINKVSITPSNISVTGPKTILSQLENVHVLTPLPNATVPGVAQVKAVPVVMEGLEVVPDKTDVIFLLGLNTKNRTIKRTVDIIVPEGIEATAKNRSVLLELEMPASRYNDKELYKDIKAELVLPDTITQGKHALSYRVYLPENAWLKKAQPETLTVTVRKR